MGTRPSIDGTESHFVRGRIPLSHHPRPFPTSAPHRTARRGWRTNRGVVLVELALVIAPLVLVVYSAIDLGRMARFQNRLTNAAREGAAVAQYHPGWVGPGTQASCSTNEGRNIIDRATGQDLDLASYPDFKVTVREVGGSAWAQGCRVQMPTGVVPGDRVQVEVQARFVTTAPFTRLLWGPTVLLERSAYVEVAGG